MTRFYSFLGCSSFALISATQLAYADVTPRDVWQDWRDNMQTLGYSLTATETMADGVLTVKDVMFEIKGGPAQPQVTATVSSISFSQNDDGSVSVAWPEVMPVSLRVVPAAMDSPPVTMAFTVTQSDQNMTVSGTPTDLTSVYYAAGLGFVLDQMTIDGDVLGPDDAKLSVAMTDVDYDTTRVIGAMRQFAQTSTVGSVTYDMVFKSPGEPAIATVNGTSQNLNYTTSGQLPLALAQASDMTEVLRAGMDVSGTMSAGNSNLTLDIEDPNSGNMALAMATQGSTFKLETSAKGVSYAGTRQGTTVSVQPPEFPFLLSFAMDNIAFNLGMPILKSDAPQNFSLGVNISDFTMSDMIWGMINPQATLPRDPAMIALDITGTATMLADQLNVQDANKSLSGQDIPAQFETVQLNSLIVDALGARLTGNGGARFDTSATGSEGEMPMPTGAIDLKLVGGTTLLNTLVDSGLLPAEAAMGARMMMGMFAVPGDGDDTLTSKLEFTRSGAILANGQRIK